MLRENKNDRGDLEFQAAGNCVGQTLTIIHPSPTNSFRRTTSMAILRSTEDIENPENYFDSSDSATKIASWSTRSDDENPDARFNEEKEMPYSTEELKRVLKEDRRLAKKGLCKPCEIETNLFDSERAAPQEVDMTLDNPKKGLYFFILHTLLMSANCYAAAAIFKLNPNVSVI